MSKVNQTGKKLGIVILNYLNYKDTIECVDSILEMDYNYEGIVIVDNNSANQSYDVLSNAYKNNQKIHTIKANKNYGFAKGNNIGITYAKNKLKADFVFVVNNDTVFTQKDYFDKLLNSYHRGVGVIGSEIHLKDNTVQDKKIYNLSLRDNLILYINFNLKIRNKDIWVLLLPSLHNKEMVQVLHGCALLLTPDFFKYYKGFYKRTFLYREEPILYLMCKRHKLIQKYVPDTFIFHKENQSTEQSFHNDKSILAKYFTQSHKFLIWWILKDQIYGIIRKEYK